MVDIEYQSSEELQRHNHDVFASGEAEKARAADRSEKDKVVVVLDKYIAKHQTTKGVREESEKNKTSLELQFGISDGIVGILEKIKNELR